MGKFGSKDKPEWLGAFVFCPTRDVTYTKIKVTPSDAHGDILKTLEFFDENFSMDTKKNSARGWTQFYKADDHPGDVIWRCTCEIEYEGLLTATPPTHTTIPDVSDDFLKLLETATDSDVTFSVRGEQIKAHRAVLLARSTYFANMFTSRMKESASGKIEVTDADPVAFWGMLEFLYGGVSPKNLDDIAMDLFAIADKYGMEKLRGICETNIIANLNADTVVDALLLAERHNRKELSSHAKAVFRANFAAIEHSQENRLKLEQHPSFLFKLLAYVAK